MYLATRDPRTASQAGPRRIRRVVAGNVIALGAVSLITDVSAEMVTAVLPLYLVLGLGLSPLQFGFLDGLYQGVTALVRILGGHAADRWQRRKLVAGVGYGLSAASKIGLLIAGSSVPGLAGALAVDRAGKGIRTAPRDALISLSSTPESLGRAFGVHRAMDTIGALLGPLVAFALLWGTAEAYDAVFVVSTCLAVLGVVLLMLFVRDHRAPIAGRAQVSVRAAFGLLRGARFRRLCLVAALLGLATVGDAFVYLLLQRRLYLDVAYFPLLPLGTAAGYLLLAVPFGRLADRVGRHRVFLGGHGALLCGYVALLGPGDGPLLFGAVLALHGAFYASTDGVLMALAGPALPAGLRTSGMALLQTGQAVARLVSSVLFGAVWTVWGPHTALVVAALVLATSLVLATTIHFAD
jgi:MFS family permease